MIADVPLGAFLSGGVDSSIVVGEMACTRSRAGQDVLDRLRREALQRAAATPAWLPSGSAPTTTSSSVEPDALGLLPTLVRHYGEPFADSSAIPRCYLAEMTRRHVTVALNGDGGDESFAGYRRHVAGAAASRLDHLPGVLRRGVAAVGGRIQAPEGKSLRSYGRRFAVSLADQGAARYARTVSIFGPEECEAILVDGYGLDGGGSVDGSEAIDPIAAAWNEAELAGPGSIHPLDRLLSVDVNTYLPGDLLVKVDIATMAHSLEARSPLLDHEVMELAASLPASMKARRGSKKWILREAYREGSGGRGDMSSHGDSDRPTLPDSILDGAKMGFAVPLGSWLRGELREFSWELLLDRSALDRGILDEAGVERVLQEHKSGQLDRSAQIWSLIVLESWLREFDN